MDIAAALINLVSAAQKMENAIHQINLYPLDNATGFPDTYPLNSNLSGGSAINKQFLDEVEHDIMNYQNRGLCSQTSVLIIHDIMRSVLSAEAEG